MVPSDIRARASKLQDAIREYRSQEHEKDALSIPESALDTLKHELYLLEARYPELVTADSPTQRVAGKPLPELRKVRHEVPQWSLEDAFTEEEVAAFLERARRVLAKSGITAEPSYCLELKIDGLKIILTYKKGELVLGATRGDGVVGEDVTHNIRTIRSIPGRLSRPIDLVVEGEIYLSRKGLAALNKQRAKEGLPLFANPRNAAAGSIRQLDPAVAAKRPLDAFLYDIDASSEPLPASQSEELEMIRTLGLPVNPHHAHADTLAEVSAYWKKWQGRAREKEDYQIDGTVLKIEDREEQEALGYTGKAPRFAIAFKFPAEQVTTVVEDITLQVGRTGVLTPVAHLRPVAVAGTVVARATLHNEDFITEKDIRIGDTVILQKAGDIIPEIVQVLPELRPKSAKRWRFPKSSPLCGGDGAIERVPGEAKWRCIVADSFGQQSRKLIHFAGKSALDIDGMGRETVKLLMEHGLVADFNDIFDLTKDELLALPKFEDKKAENLLAGIKAARGVPLDRLLTGLSIPHVGEENARLLAERFGTLAKLRIADEDAFARVEGLGPILASTLAAWFADSGNQALLDRLLKYLKVQKVAAPVGGLLLGKTVVVTGTLPTLSREEAEELIRKAGGKAASSVSKKTAFLLAGEAAGTKLRNAEQLGVEVIGEAEFKKRLGV